MGEALLDGATDAGAGAARERPEAVDEPEPRVRVADEVEHRQAVLALLEPQAAPELLEEHRRALGRAQEEDGVDRRHVEARRPQKSASSSRMIRTPLLFKNDTRMSTRSADASSRRISNPTRRSRGPFTKRSLCRSGSDGRTTSPVPSRASATRRTARSSSAGSRTFVRVDPRVRRGLAEELDEAIRQRHLLREPLLLRQVPQRAHQRVEQVPPEHVRRRLGVQRLPLAVHLRPRRADRLVHRARDDVLVEPRYELHPPRLPVR